MTLLRNDFTFGFELEAFARNSDFIGCYDENDFAYNLDECDCNVLYDFSSYLDDFYDNINRFFARSYNLRGYTHYDGSLKNYEDGYTGFEWSSPVLQFSTKNLMAVKNLLHDLNINDIHINPSCGFHTHFSYKGICEDDVLWILLYISANDEVYNKFTEFEYTTKGKKKDVSFWNERYADAKYLKDIKEAFKTNDYKKLCSCFSDYKYRVLRVHPQGTLEWRGPREFLYSHAGIDAYIKRMYEVVDIFIKALNTREICGFTREDFYECVRENMIYDKHFSPDITLKEIRRGSHGVFPWFWDKKNKNNYDRCVSPRIIEGFVTKIINNPIEINDIKYSDYMPVILSMLNNKNCLRRVVESVLNSGVKLNRNIQYKMVFENITLLPLVEPTVMKYFSLPSLSELFGTAPFNVESNYKHKLIDFIFTDIKNNFDIVGIVKLLGLLVRGDKQQWVVKYIMTKHINAVKNIFSKYVDNNIKNKKARKDVMKKFTDEMTYSTFRQICFNIEAFNIEEMPQTTLNSDTTTSGEYTFVSSTNNNYFENNNFRITPLYEDLPTITNVATRI